MLLFFQQELYLLLEYSLDPVLSDDLKCWLVSRMDKLGHYCMWFVRREVLSFGSVNLVRLHCCMRMAALVWLLNIWLGLKYESLPFLLLHAVYRLLSELSRKKGLQHF